MVGNSHTQLLLYLMNSEFHLRHVVGIIRPVEFESIDEYGGIFPIGHLSGLHKWGQTAKGPLSQYDVFHYFHVFAIGEILSVRAFPVNGGVVFNVEGGGGRGA